MECCSSERQQQFHRTVPAQRAYTKCLRHGNPIKHILPKSLSDAKLVKNSPAFHVNHTILFLSQKDLIHSRIRLEPYELPTAVDILGQNTRIPYWKPLCQKYAFHTGTCLKPEGSIAHWYLCSTTGIHIKMEPVLNQKNPFDTGTCPEPE